MKTSLLPSFTNHCLLLMFASGNHLCFRRLTYFFFALNASVTQLHLQLTGLPACCWACPDEAQWWRLGLGCVLHLRPVGISLHVPSVSFHSPTPSKHVPTRSDLSSQKQLFKFALPGKWWSYLVKSRCPLSSCRNAFHSSSPTFLNHL